MKRKSKARAILSNYHELKERRYSGAAFAIDAFLDFEQAIKVAKLTDKQTQAIQLHYYNGFKQAKVAEIMGIAQKNVSELLERAISEIDDVYEMWAWLDGELSAEDFAEETEASA